MKLLQRALRFDILRQGLLGLALLAQRIGFLNHVVNADVLIIGTFGLRSGKSRQQSQDNREPFHGGQDNEANTL